MVATHVSHRLVHNARLFMKKASWGCFVLVFDSSGEPAGHPDFSESCALGFSGTEFEVGRTSREDGVGATVHAPIDYERVNYVLFYVLFLGSFWSVSSLFVFKSNRSPNFRFWRGGHLDRS